MTTLAPGRTLLALWFLTWMGAPLWAGPPFRTDDPQPVDLGHLELYLFSTGERRSDGGAGLGPALEVNGGLLPDVQLHLGVSRAYDRPRGAATHGGLGDTEVGIKYRVFHETDTRPQVGFFPMVVLPTGKAQAGLGSGHTQVTLPVWVQKSWGPWTTYGGYGWWRSPGDGNRNWSYAGWLAQRDFGEKLTLGLEAFRHTAATPGGVASTGFNAGGQVNLSERHHLLFSGGRQVTGEKRNLFYVGYQLTAGPFAGLRDWFHRGRSTP